MWKKELGVEVTLDNAEWAVYIENYNKRLLNWSYGLVR